MGGECRPTAAGGYHPLVTERQIGQCAGCANAVVQTSAKGHDFWRCRLADEDERFMRYPPLPVADCAGFEPVSESD
jgi:hypothetical protein